MRRGPILAVLALLALSAAAFAADTIASFVSRGEPAAQSSGPPNVLVIMTDDQTVESLRVMPEVERLLADDGTTFQSYFATTPQCCPSRASFLTGQYSHNHRVRSNGPPKGGYDRLDGSRTLPVWLERSGYRTAYIGRYLNRYGGKRPREVPPGWDDWHVPVGSSAYRMYDYTLNEDGRLVDYGDGTSDYQTDVLAERSARLLERHADGERPFFLTFAPLAPHAEGGNRRLSPRPAPRHRGRYRDEPLPRPPSFAEEDVSDKPSFIQALERPDSEEIDRLELVHRARLESLVAVDEAVSHLVQVLRDANQLSNTLIVFTSDNGFFLGEHRIAKGKLELYEEATRVPLIIRGPGVPTGAVRDQLVGNIDLAPTILDVAGARGAADRKLDGRSLMPLAADPTAGLGRDLLFETQRYSAIRTLQHVYARHSTGERELYDLQADPFQLESRHGDPAYRLLRQDLDERLRQLRGCAGQECR